jgi:outer membrane protein assembly factor BamE (lipoprotein component of BamABCDE complex)
MEDIDRYYEILELRSGASLEEVKRTYRDLVRVWHPDRFSHDPRLQQKTQEKLKEINEAYEKLQAFLRGQRGSRGNSKGSAGRWPATVAWLRNEYGLMPTVVKITVAVILLLIVITSTQNSGSKQITPEPDKTSLVALASKPVSEPQGTVARPGRKAGPENEAAGPPKEAPKTATAELETAPANRESGGEHAVSHRLPDGYFTIGSSKDHLLAIQGPPSRVDGNTFNYAYSSVDFRRDRVSGYSNVSKNLKVRLLPSGESSGASSPGYFTIGSSKDDVLVVQGTPSSVYGNRFEYGHSSVDFRDDRVSGYSNISKDLKVRLLPSGESSGASSPGYFTIGSSKDDVLAVQGTPSSVDGNTFEYGYSSVYFTDDRVLEYSNISKNLKVRVTLKSVR